MMELKERGTVEERELFTAERIEVIRGVKYVDNDLTFAEMDVVFSTSVDPLDSAAVTCVYLPGGLPADRLVWIVRQIRTSFYIGMNAENQRRVRKTLRYKVRIAFHRGLRWFEDLIDRS